MEIRANAPVSQPPSLLARRGAGANLKQEARQRSKPLVLRYVHHRSARPYGSADRGFRAVGAILAARHYPLSQSWHLSRSNEITRPPPCHVFLRSGSAHPRPPCCAASKQPPPGSAASRQATSNSGTLLLVHSANDGPAADCPVITLPLKSKLLSGSVAGTWPPLDQLVSPNRARSWFSLTPGSQIGRSAQPDVVRHHRGSGAVLSYQPSTAPAREGNVIANIT